MANRIWDCKIQLRKVNPDKRSRTKYILGNVECLVILDNNQEFVDIKTNRSVVNRYIKNLYGNKFDIEDIYTIEPIKDLGPSYTKY